MTAAGEYNKEFANTEKSEKTAMESSIPTGVDEYIAGFPLHVREMMATMRDAVHEAVPGVKEKISWAMPTFYIKKILVQFAGFKNHIGFFPGPDAIEHFARELSGFKTSKGGIHFPYTEPIPIELVKKIARYRRAAEIDLT